MKQDNDKALANSYGNAELAKLLESALGLTLATMDIHANIQDNVDAIVNAFRDKIITQTENHKNKVFIFGCSLFPKLISGFSIGPVRIESRLEWLEHKKQAKEISAITHRRLKAKWEGKKIAKRRSGNDVSKEKAIIDAVGEAHYIVSVTIKNFPDETGQEKALQAARLALTTVALLWNSPSDTLDGLNLNVDRSFYHKKTLYLTDDNLWGYGSKISHDPHGPFVAPDVWEAELVKHKNLFSICGKVLDYMLTADGNCALPKTMNTLAQALTWLHAACREQNNLISIVKFAACLDALSCGGETSGIQKLITKQFGVPADKPVFKGGVPLAQTVNHIYGYGRSRTIHGNNEKFGHDWSTTRRQAEALARLCFIMCAETAAKNPTVDDPEQFSK